MRWLFMFVSHIWIFVGLLIAVPGAGILLSNAPLLGPKITLSGLVIFSYMIHQFEEHYNHRFQVEFNASVGRGYQVLSPESICVINVVGVWGITVASTVLAVRVDCGYALMGAFLCVVNGMIHVGRATHLRSTNAGLVTSVLLLIPLGGATIFTLRSADWTFHLFGLAIALLGHLAILLYAHGRLKLLQRGKVGHDHFSSGV